MALASVVPSDKTTSLLLEREAQVAALQALADAVRQGGGRFVVIEGSAGIGKTRLLAEARAIAGSAGVRGLGGRGGGVGGELAPSLRGSWRRGPPGSCASRCSRPPLRISAVSCSRGRPRS